MYETLENQKMVYDKYKEAFDRLGDAEKVFVTDGNRKTDLIAEDIRIAVEALIGPGNN